MEAFKVWDFYEGGNLKYFLQHTPTRISGMKPVFLYIRLLLPESIEWFIEDQAFSSSYDLAPPPPPLSRQKDRPATHMSTEKDSQLGGYRAKLYDGE